MHPDDRHLPPQLLAHLAALATHPAFEPFYLAGSAGLALYLGHRRSGGLDLMSLTARLASAERRDLLGALVELDSACSVETARDGFLFARLGDGTAVRFYYYPYPLVDEEQEIAGLALASALDLGLMKLAAIVSRGTRRDFVDLFALCRRIPLDALIDRAPEKFGHVRDFPLQALKGLADRSQAEEEPPGVATGIAWAEVTAWAATAVQRIGRERLGFEEPSERQ